MCEHSQGKCAHGGSGMSSSNQSATLSSAQSARSGSNNGTPLPGGPHSNATSSDSDSCDDDSSDEEESEKPELPKSDCSDSPDDDGSDSDEGKSARSTSMETTPGGELQKERSNKSDIGNSNASNGKTYAGKIAAEANAERRARQDALASASASASATKLDSTEFPALPAMEEQSVEYNETYRKPLAPARLGGVRPIASTVKSRTTGGDGIYNFDRKTPFPKGIGEVTIDAPFGEKWQKVHDELHTKGAAAFPKGVNHTIETPMGGLYERRDEAIRLRLLGRQGQDVSNKSKPIPPHVRQKQAKSAHVPAANQKTVNAKGQQQSTTAQDKSHTATAKALGHTSSSALTATAPEFTPPPTKFSAFADITAPALISKPASTPELTFRRAGNGLAPPLPGPDQKRREENQRTQERMRKREEIVKRTLEKNLRETEERNKKHRAQLRQQKRWPELLHITHTMDAKMMEQRTIAMEGTPQPKCNHCGGNSGTKCLTLNGMCLCCMRRREECGCTYTLCLSGWLRDCHHPEMCIYLHYEQILVLCITPVEGLSDKVPLVVINNKKPPAGLLPNAAYPWDFVQRGNQPSILERHLVTEQAMAVDELPENEEEWSAIEEIQEETAEIMAKLGHEVFTVRPSDGLGSIRQQPWFVEAFRLWLARRPQDQAKSAQQMVIDGFNHRYHRQHKMDQSKPVKQRHQAHAAATSTQNGNPSGANAGGSGGGGHAGSVRDKNKNEKNKDKNKNDKTKTGGKGSKYGYEHLDDSRQA